MRRSRLSRWEIRTFCDPAIEAPSDAVAAGMIVAYRELMSKLMEPVSNSARSVHETGGSTPQLHLRSRRAGSYWRPRHA